MTENLHTEVTLKKMDNNLSINIDLVQQSEEEEA